LLETHCNKEELLSLLAEYRAKGEVAKKKTESKAYKKIDANFFKI
jgi:hypothetical protein